MNEDTCVLVVDDQPENICILQDLLSPQYQVQTAADGIEALQLLRSDRRVHMVITDVMMPNMDGFDLCREMRADARLHDIPILFLTSLESSADESIALAIGGDDFIHKPFSPSAVVARVHNHLKLARATRMLRENNENLEALVAIRTAEILHQAKKLARQEQSLINAQRATITAFCVLAEARDNETGNHIRRTQHYIKALATRLRDQRRGAGELDDETIELLFMSAPLHDVGKVAIPDAILHKPGKLNETEWLIMRRHCDLGRDAIALTDAELDSDASFLRCGREIAYGHHEHWDGSGYPLGATGTDIPLSARLMAAADVYDALISARIYKPAFTHETAFTMMIKERGKHFDPDIIDAMLSAEQQFRDIARQYADTEDSDQQRRIS